MSLPKDKFHSMYDTAHGHIHMESNISMCSQTAKGQLIYYVVIYLLPVHEVSVALVDEIFPCTYTLPSLGQTANVKMALQSLWEILAVNPGGCIILKSRL